MPSNQIVINKAAEYYVGDSRMEELLKWLDINGFKRGEEPDEEKEPDKEEEP